MLVARRLLLFLLLTLLLGCPASDGAEPTDDDDATADDDDATADDDDSGGKGDDDDASSPEPLLTTWSFAASEASFDNPERGFYRTTSLVDGSWFYEGYTLSFSYVRLDDYRDVDLPESLLSAVELGLQAAREAGVKIILRFSYNWGPWPDSEPDAPLEQVLAHIEQLTPLLVDNADVLAVVQAGFIGAWGEWHSSTHDLLSSKDIILGALLEAVPPERMLQVRTPVHKNDIFGNVPFDPADAHSGLDHARVGHHNDCFLASDNDWGTYPPDAIELWKGHVASETLYTPMGGETCNPNPPRSDCDTALAELEQLHFSYINHEYHPEVVDSWTAGGCRQTMEQKLGYRLVLDSAEVLAGQSALVSLELSNVGWAAPFNPRTAWLVVDGDTAGAVELPSDPRSWLPGTTVPIEASIEGLAPGSHDLALWLPDSAPGLREDPRYSIRLAHDGLWDEATGLNQLGSFEVPGG